MPAYAPFSGGSVAKGSSSTYGKYTPITPRPLIPGTSMPGAPAAPGAPGTGGNDYTKAAMGRLQSIAEGKDVPLDDATKANMLSKSQEGAAAAEQAQNQTLMEGAVAGGASPNDPSLQAAKRQNMAARQGSNQQAARDIELETRRQNFAASQGAAESLAGFGQAQQRIDQNDPANNVQMLPGGMPGGASSGPSALGMQYNPAAGGGQSAVNQAAMSRLGQQGGGQPAPRAKTRYELSQEMGNRLSGTASVRQAQNAADRGTGPTLTQQNRYKASGDYYRDMGL